MRAWIRRSVMAVCGAVMVAAGSAGVAGAAEHGDVVDLSVRHQVIDNFGASDAWTMQRIGAWSEESKNKVADLLFSTEKGIGLSLWRFNIGGGINNTSIRNPWRTVETFETAEGKYDWTRQANERWFAQAARDRGVPYLLGFVNSPPGRMTKNGLTNSGDDTTSSTNFKPGMEKQYARYLCDMVEHFRDAPAKERLVFNYLSPVNEPQAEWAAGSQEGNRCDNETIKRIVAALHEEIAARKLEVKVRAMESSSVPDLMAINNASTRKYGAPYGDYLKVLAGDAAVAPLLDGVLCYHDYHSYTAQTLVPEHERLGKAMGGYPGLKLWMSEICILQPRRDLTMAMALDVAKLMHADLVLSSASAWQWWLAVSNGDYKDGLLYTNWRRAGDPESIIESKTFWAVGNYSRFVRPGMQRVELVGDKHGFDGLLGSAYVDARTGKVVLVYVNVSKEEQRVSWQIKGAAGVAIPARFTPYVTSEGDSLAGKPVVPVGSGATIPPSSVVTFVSQ